jgi:hypothetical protein
MVHRVAKSVVDFGRMGGGTVDQGRHAGRGPAALGQAGVAAVQVVGQRFLEQAHGLRGQAGEQRGMPVDHCAFGMVQHLVR